MITCRSSTPLPVAFAALVLFGCEPSAQRSDPNAPTSSAVVVPPSPPETASASPPATSSAATGASSPTPVASAADGGAAGTSVQTLFVDARKVACEGGAGPMRCLQVRSAENEPWRRFYSSIEGFTYEEGNAYELRVTSGDVAKPPADAPSRKYKLVEIVSKRKMDAGL